MMTPFRRIPVLIGLLAALVPAAAAADIPRPEYPRPDLVRADWLNLNGAWEFALDFSASGEARGLPEGQGFDRRIIVPFAPESPLSGVGVTDFIPAAWYKRTVDVPGAWRGRRVRLNFEACDYETTVWVNGRRAGSHSGGYTPFGFDITDLLGPGPNTLVVRAQDDVRAGRQPAGKQSTRWASYSCFYRRTTGIWQTVWLEPVAETHVTGYDVASDAANGEAVVTVRLNRAPEASRLRLRVLDGGREIGAFEKAAGLRTDFVVKIENPRLWDIRRPNLYDFEIALERDGRSEDGARGYFGLRTFEIRGNRFFLNGRPLFMRLVLDQGFYPDGIYTAPTDAALRNDIEISLGLGFDGARLHQKVFERRFLHWADRLGYIVWGEFADWGLDLGRPEAWQVFAREWGEAVMRDRHHPALVGWCPLNEKWGANYPGTIENIFRLTKLLDPVRPAIDASGGFHEAAPDVFDAHNYEQDAAAFKAAFDGLLASPPKIYMNGDARRNTPYRGQPYFVSEYGGIWWNPGQADDKAWGYGDRPRTLQEFLDRYKALTDALLDNPAVAGWCYTQITDVEQEVNGLYTFDRQPKHDPKYFFEVNQRRAAVEK